MLPPNTTQDNSKPRKPPQLPFEIHDLTLSHLQDNKAALDRCSLVSRSWLQLSRHYLFRTLAVTSSRGSFSNFILLLRTAQYVGESIETLTLRGPPPSAAEAMGPSASHSPVVSPDLLYRLAERTPKLKTLVLARVRFLPNSDSNSTSNLDPASESNSNSSSTVPEPLDGGSDVVSRKLRKLILASTTHRPVALGVPTPPPRHPDHTLTGTTVDGAYSQGRDVSASVPPRLSLGLERLHLTDMASIPEKDVPNILAAIAVFSEIDELGLYHLTAPSRLVRFRGSPAPQLRSQQRGPIRSLVVSAGHATFSSAVYCMLEHLVTTGMTALSWASNNMLLLEAFGRFLRPNAPHLRTLKLSMGTWVFDSVTHLPNSVFFKRWDSIIQFSQFPVLDTLTLVYDARPFRSDEDGVHPAFSTYTYLLTHPPPSLRHLTLLFPLPGDHEARPQGLSIEERIAYVNELREMQSLWDKLDAVLARIASLEGVDVVFCGRGARMSDKMLLSVLVTERMPTMQDREIVKVTWQDCC
ncbi:hypothetical protein C8Q74DRAFT_1373950 [Fomes fomentarius]|nr:hypothetical protein C8Q74DRAFT_1373950 [Fomes fomentarius]